MTSGSVPAQMAELVEQITAIGARRHSQAIIAHAKANLANIGRTIRDLPAPNGDKGASAIVISAGPSVRRRDSIGRILAAKFRGTIIAVDGSYVACLRQGLIPDYVVTLDPHPTRMVRWFGDHDFEAHAARDNYFERQDLDVEFRKGSVLRNRENIALVNKHGSKTKAIIASTAPPNVVARLQEAGTQMYWWNPLVDSPRAANSITRALFELNRLPSLNTGGNVGTASWVFAAVALKIPRIGLVGVDLGYYRDTPREQTQTYHELLAHLGGPERIEECFVELAWPLTGEVFYTDPTYYWYRRNFLDLATKVSARTINCTEGGVLFGEGVACATLDDFLAGAG